jgi:hypothetical protein
MPKYKASPVTDFDVSEYVPMSRSTAFDADSVAIELCSVSHASVSVGPHERCRFRFRVPVE